jgi:ADP-ribose pyrophosphatase YjhB (NUDIX family)
MALLHGWRYCPRCRAELLLEDGRAQCTSCDFVAYANSAPTASALVLDEEGRILLARRAHEPWQGRWDIPGGFSEEGEHPLEALVRELREETGLTVEPLELFAIEMDWYGDGADAQATLNLYWTARAVGGDPRPADDVTELAWFSPHELPPRQELAFSNIVKVLEAWRDEQA